MAYESAGIVAAKLLPTALGTISSIFHVDLQHFFDAASGVEPQHGAYELTSSGGGSGRTPDDPITPDHFGDRPVSDTMEHAFQGNDTDTDLNNDSPFMKATRAVAIEYANNQHMTPAQRDAFVNAFMKDVYSHKQDFIDAYNDHSGKFSRGNIQDAFLKDGKFIMGNGAFTAQYTDLKLTQPEQAVQYTYTYTDPAGHKQVVHLNVADRCLNPLMDQQPTPVAETVPAPVETPKSAVTYQVDPYHADDCTSCGPKKLLLATIHLPNADINSPESQAVINKALAEIEQTQKAVGSDYRNFTGITYVGPDNQIIQVKCMEEGSTDPHDWYLTDKRGNHVGKVDAKTFARYIDGTLEDHGDGYAAPVMEAKVTHKPDGTISVEPQLSDKATWMGKQDGVFKGDILNEHRPADVKAFTAVLSQQIPPDFFSWSHDARVRYFESQGLSPNAAKDLAYWLEGYSNEASGKKFVRVAAAIAGQPGDTFDSFMKRGFDAQYDYIKSH